MFAALCENLEFFKPKINLAIMLAPVARVDRLSSPTIQKIKNNETLRDFIENTIGPEIMPTPQVDGKISAGLVKITGLANFSVGLFSDEDPT